MMALLFALADTVLATAPSDTAALAAQTTAPMAHGQIDYLNMILKASIPVKVIIFLLLTGSFTSWAIIFRKRRIFRIAHRLANSFESRFWSGADLGRLYEAANENHQKISGLEAIFESGFREFTRLRERKLDSRAQMVGTERAMRTILVREVDQLEHHLELLANIGSTAPYVGLVGTVFGIMGTMHDMVASGQQSGISAVAPGISEALFATAIGLFVAIPAVWAYNRFTTRVDRLTVRYETFAEEFSAILQRQAGGGQ